MGCFWSTNKERFDQTSKTLYVFEVVKNLCFCQLFQKFAGSDKKTSFLSGPHSLHSCGVAGKSEQVQKAVTPAFAALMRGCRSGQTGQA